MVRYALLGLLREQADYGYRLKRRFDERVGSLWQLNIGQVYQTLSALKREGLVAVTVGQWRRCCKGTLRSAALALARHWPRMARAACAQTLGRRRSSPLMQARYLHRQWRKHQASLMWAMQPAPVPGLAHQRIVGQARGSRWKVCRFGCEPPAV